MKSIFIIALIIAFIAPSAFAQNCVLSLDGAGDYVEIPEADILDLTDNFTFEAWVFPITPASENMIFNKERAYQWAIKNGNLQWALETSVMWEWHDTGLSVPVNQWIHFALTYASPNVSVYANGVLLGTIAHPQGEKLSVNDNALRIGARNLPRFAVHAEFFAGQIDEVRIWNVVRTQKEIQAARHTILSGKEPGLVGYWRFDGIGETIIDSSLNHLDGKLMGDAHLIEAELPEPNELVISTVLSGMITDEAGKPIPNASVRLEQNGEEITRVQTDNLGNYWIALFYARGLYDLSAISDELGNWQLGILLHEGERRTINLMLRKAISIEGTVLMLDDMTPHVAIPVQVMSDGKVVDGVSTDENGKYRFINLKPGQYQVRCYTPGKYLYFGQKASAAKGALLQVERGKALRNIDFRSAPLKKGIWKHYTIVDGLGNMSVRDIYQDSDGTLWFGTGSFTWLKGGGVSCYDGERFITFTTEDGLAHNAVHAVKRGSDDVMWFGTLGGISRYDGKEFVNLTSQDGLAHNLVRAICGAQDGTMWFGTWGGISQYDGSEFINFNAQDGLVHNNVFTIHVDSDGVIWFGTWGGISRYDGKEFVNFTTEDGLCNNTVYAIHRDSDGVLWFATSDGISRYDGKKFVNFTTKDGLVNNVVFAIDSTPDGVLWFGTSNGVSRYDGVGFVNFTTKDGLLDEVVAAIHCDADGTIWFGTRIGGVSRYDEQTLITFNTDDGLAHNRVQAIHREPDDMLWLGTADGVSRYGGKNFVNYTTKDGLAHNCVGVIHRDPSGILWFGTGYIDTYVGSGVSRYDPFATQADGKHFVNFTMREGLASNLVIAIHSEPNGVMWFGHAGHGVSRYNGDGFVSFTTKGKLANKGVYAIRSDSDDGIWFGTGHGGVSRYDGKEFVNFTTKEGLADNAVIAIYVDLDGTLWFGTWGGISRYNGEKFVNLTIKDGLAGNLVDAIYREPNGILWFGTDGGASGYDGTTWTSLDIRDGLKDNRILSINQGSDGTLWFGTYNGLTRYRRNKTKPKVRIVAIQTDKDYTVDTYRGLSQQIVPPITTGTRVTIEYNAIDFKTIPEKRQYRCRIKEIDEDWRPPIRLSSFDYTFKEPGDYTFLVQAIDRDLNYSEPDSITLNIVPPWYLNGLIVFPSGGGILAMVMAAIFFASRYYLQRRESQRLQAEMREQERQNLKILEAKNTELEDTKDAAESANRAKSTFLANMSHEIRTPMNAILGYAQILQREPNLPPNQRQAVGTIKNSGNHLLALINDVLDLSKIEAGRLELNETDFELNTLIDTLSAMFQMRCEQKGLDWRVEWLNGQDTRSIERTLVHGDEGKLRQVLINLLGNAIKFTESGKVILRISPKSGDVAEFPRIRDSLATSATPNSSHFTFEVIDTGVGISPQDQAKIFDPFHQGEQTARQGGTGLGLAIAKRYIELMGGELELESPPLNPPQIGGEVRREQIGREVRGGQIGEEIKRGSGSRFFFTIPLADATSDTIAETSEWSDVTRLAEGYYVKALIADDTEVNRNVLSKMLSDLGIEVIEAENGQQAVEMFREHRPDIVFMDIRMPVMDGMEAAQQILEDFGECNGEMSFRPTIVAISASTLKHEQEEYLQAGFDDFISKPFRFERVCECLANLLEVEFEIDETDEVEEQLLETPPVTLPAELLMQLKAAAKGYRVTELKDHLNEIERVGLAGQKLAKRLSELILSYDMDTVIKILSEIKPE